MKLAKRILDVAPSQTLAITSLAKKMSAEGRRVINFAAGEPDWDTPRHIKEAAKRALEEGFTKYTPASGTLKLKEAICEKLKSENGLNYKPEQVVVSCGAKHSIYNILQVLCQEKDEVIIPSPYWVSYPPMAKLARAVPSIVETTPEEEFKLSPKKLKAAISKKTKLLILNSPSNPTGTVYSSQELGELVELAAANGVYILSDEIYEKLIYDGLSHTSAAKNKGASNFVITVNGVSKTYSMTGWRIGYMAGPKEIAEAVTKLQSHSTSNPTSISQKAALEAISGQQDFVGRVVAEFEKKRNLLVEGLKSIPQLSPFKPSGAFYVFCDISRTGLDSITFSKRLLKEKGVAVVPGAAFGSDAYVRLSFATSLENIKEGVNIIKEWLK